MGRFRTKGQKKSHKSTKFCKPLFSFSRTFVFLLHHLFLQICNYLTGIIYHNWLNSQLQVSDICEPQGLFFKISSSKNIKTKSSKDLVCYVICAEAPKVQSKCLLILAWVKTPLVREYAGTWILETIDHDIIQLFDRNNMAQRSGYQLYNHNNPLEECFAATRIEKLYNPVLLLYTLGF